MSVDLLLLHTGRLRASVSVWSASRWTAAPHLLPGLPPTAGTCAGVAAHLVQALADLGADAEGRPRRRVPPPDSDLVLPDQLLVMAYDIVFAEPDDALVGAALDEVLLHRAEIDGARAEPQLVSRAAAACALRHTGQVSGARDI